MWKVQEVFNLIEFIYQEQANPKPTPMQLLALTIDALVKKLPATSEKAEAEEKFPSRQFLEEFGAYCKIQKNQNVVEFIERVYSKFPELLIKKNELHRILAAFFAYYFDVCIGVIRSERIPQDCLIKATAQEVYRVKYQPDKEYKNSEVGYSDLEMQSQDLLGVLIAKIDPISCRYLPLNSKQTLNVIQGLLNRLIQLSADEKDAEKIVADICTALFGFAQAKSIYAIEVFTGLIDVLKKQLKKYDSKKETEFNQKKIIGIFDVLFKLKLSDEEKNTVIKETQQAINTDTLKPTMVADLADRLIPLKLSLANQPISDESLTRFVEKLYNVEISGLTIAEDKIGRLAELCRREFEKITPGSELYGSCLLEAKNINLFCNNLIKLFFNVDFIKNEAIRILNLHTWHITYKHKNELQKDNKYHKRRDTYFASFSSSYQMDGKLLEDDPRTSLINCLQYELQLLINTILKPPTIPVTHRFFGVSYNTNWPNETEIEKAAKVYCSGVSNMYQLLAKLSPEQTDEQACKRYEDSQTLMGVCNKAKSVNYDILFENCMAAVKYSRAMVPEAWKILITSIKAKVFSPSDEKFAVFERVARACLLRWPYLFSDIIALFYQGEYVAQCGLAIIREALAVGAFYSSQLTDLKRQMQREFNERKLGIASAVTYRTAYLAVKKAIQNLDVVLTNDSFFEGEDRNQVRQDISVLEFQRQSILEEFTSNIEIYSDPSHINHLPLASTQISAAVNQLLNTLLLDMATANNIDEEINHKMQVLLQMVKRKSEFEKIIIPTLIAVMHQLDSESKIAFIVESLWQMPLSKEQKLKIIENRKLGLQIRAKLKLSVPGCKLSAEEWQSVMDHLNNDSVDELIVSEDKEQDFIQLCEQEFLRQNEKFSSLRGREKISVGIFYNNILKIFPKHKAIKEMARQVLGYFVDHFVNSGVSLEELKRQRLFLAQNVPFPHYQLQADLFTPDRLKQLKAALTAEGEKYLYAIKNSPCTYVMSDQLGSYNMPDYRAGDYCLNIPQISHWLCILFPQEAEIYRQQRYIMSDKIILPLGNRFPEWCDVLFENCLAAVEYSKASIPSAWKRLIDLMIQKDQGLIKRFAQFTPVAAKVLVKWPELFVGQHGLISNCLGVLDLFYQGNGLGEYALQLVSAAVTNLPYDQLVNLKRTLEDKYQEEKLAAISSLKSYQFAYLSVLTAMQDLSPQCLESKKAEISSYAFAADGTIGNGSFGMEDESSAPIYQL